MRVLVVADVLGEENNGTTIACMNLVRYLQKCGDDVRVLCCDKAKEGLPNFYVVPTLNLGPLNKIVEKNNVSLAKPKKSIILKALEGVDIVHIMMPFALGNKTAKICKKLNIPMTAGFHVQAENFTAHIQMMNVKFANKLTYKHFYKKLYRHVNAIHYPTEFIHRTFEGVVKRRTNAYVISNGVNDIYKKMEVERVGELKGKFNILFIGRISKEKSHSVLVKAVSKSKYKDNIQLIFAGQGPRKEEVLDLATKLGINPPIVKFVSREELVRIINSCDLYVHPAEIEIEAISCLEAITCGLVPVISDSKRSATNNFALNDTNLFRNNSSTDLAKKIDYWIEHPEEKEQCSKDYLGYTKMFDQDTCMKSMREMLLTYADEKNRVPGKKNYYRDELNDDFAFLKIQKRTNLKPFKYVHKNPFFNGFAWFLYHIFARPIVWTLNKIIFHQRIKNKAVLKQCRKQGYFVYCNHTNGMPDAFTPNLLSLKRNHIVVGQETVSIRGLRGIVTMLGAIPLPNGVQDINNYYECLKKRIDQKRAITIYPEAHIWPYYTKIRPFSKNSFRYPVDLNVPVFAITNTWQKRHFRKKKVKLVSYISGPYYPDTTLQRNDAMEELRDTVYKDMVRISNSTKQFEKIKYIKVDK